MPNKLSAVVTAMSLAILSLTAHAQDHCKKLETVNFEQAADNPAVVIKARHVTDAKEALEFQFMFGKRSVVQGAYVGEDVTELPPHCRVEGYVAPAVKFLILLPEPDVWNGNVIYGSCDAFCGAVDEDIPVPLMLRGYAAIATDGGHINKRPFDGVWGYNNREAEIDFGHRASHVAAQIVKAVAKEYYGRESKYAYITGFSKGGHAGIKAALTYPEDYDGVLARAPVVRYQEINAVRLPWIAKSNTGADGSYILQADDAMLLHKAAIKSCDDTDGLEDGIIDDPRRCDFDPGALLCETGQGEASCLSEAQVQVARKFYSLPENDNGEVAYPYPLEVGSELDWPGFHVPRAPGQHPYAESIARTYIRYIAFDTDPGPDYDWRDFDGVREADRLKALKPIIDADGVDLKAFRDAGGKMIVLHGWGDGAVSARMTLDWFENMRNYMGESTSDFAQLYLLPGNKHGGSPADGPNINNSLEALEKWVEEGIEPESLLLHGEVDGEIVRTRPAYPYPAVAKYKGEGSINEAANFEAVVPEETVADRR